MSEKKKSVVDLGAIYDADAVSAFVAAVEDVIEMTKTAAEKQKKAKQKSEKKKANKTIKCCKNAKEHLKKMTDKIEEALCENIQLELVENDNDKWYRFGEHNKYGVEIAEKWKEGTTIVIVLESPHKDEYKDKIDDRYLLARGSTGSMLKCVFCDILEKLVEKSAIGEGEIKSQCRLIIMNAIPFQCSLGEDTKLYRDAVFRALWENQSITKDKEKISCDFNQKFYNCLSKYEPDIIFNFCTKGDDKTKDTLQDLVQVKIDDYAKGNNVLCFVGNHPYSWGNRNNLKITTCNGIEIVSAKDFAL